MSKLEGLLFVNTALAQVSFEGRELPIKKKWAVLYALLALRHTPSDLEPNWVTADDIALLPTWEEAELKTIRTSVFRHVDNMVRQGFALIRSPNSERTKRFALEGCVKNVKFDVSTAAVETWLNPRGLHQPTAITSAAWSEAAAFRFGLARILLLKGEFAECIAEIDHGLESEPNRDQWVQLIAQRALAHARLGNASAAQADVLELQQALTRFKRDAKPNDTLSPECEALVWIQSGRFYLRRNPSKARAAYEKAATLLEPHHHREWGAIHAGLCFLDFNVGKLEASDAHASQSLRFFMKAQDFQGVEAQFSNLSSNQMTWYLHLEKTDPPKAHHHLDEAIRYNTWSLEFAKVFDFGGAGEQELNMAYLERLRGNLDTARTWLVDARRMVNTKHNKHDLVMVEVEAAELEEVIGNRAEAVTYLERALELLAAQPMLEWQRKIKRRLKALRGVALMNEPLKLW